MVLLPARQVVPRYICLVAMTQARASYTPSCPLIRIGAAIVPIWAFTIELYRGRPGSSVALATINMLAQTGSLVRRRSTTS